MIKFTDVEWRRMTRVNPVDEGWWKGPGPNQTVTYYTRTTVEDATHGYELRPGKYIYLFETDLVDEDFLDGKRVSEKVLVITEEGEDALDIVEEGKEDLNELGDEDEVSKVSEVLVDEDES